MPGVLTYKGKEYLSSTVEGDKLEKASGHIGDALAAEQLSVDTLSATIRDYSTVPRLLTFKGVIVAAEGMPLVCKDETLRLDQRQQYGEVVEYHHNDNLICRFYLESIKRVGQYAYRLNCLSGIGMLLTSYHYGGIYTGQTVEEVVSDIIGGIVPFSIEESLAKTPLYGWLKKSKRRDNLRDVLFAVGAQIRKDVAGQIVIVPMEAKEPYEISSEEFYMGGSVTGNNPATGVDVTEHSFVILPTDREVTLYEGEAAAENVVTPKGLTVYGVLVDFQNPCHDLQIQNGEILEYGDNYAVISQSPAALLTGKQYTHVERIISRRSGATTVPNVITSNACTLVNTLNVDLVADRLMAYYGNSKTIETDIVVTGQKPGDAVTFVDPFGDTTEGYISDMELIMSATLKARTTLISGFIPTSSGNYYKRVMTITESGPVIIPDDCVGKIRVVAIGGGDGGQIGEAGNAGTGSSFGSSVDGIGGDGGAPGTPGNSGKVYVATMEVMPGDEIMAVIGAGGLGQTTTTNWTAGGATVFGNITSDDGLPSIKGYIEFITGNVYALPGENGVPGGKGSGSAGEGTPVEYDGITYQPGKKGSSRIGIEATAGYRANGGHGGGPAAGADGNNGGDGTISWQPKATGGNGGAGATPVKGKDGSVPGQGGGAGHGGGGGGGGGAATGDASYIWPGSGGGGGAPGPAGDGASGVLLIFY